MNSKFLIFWSLAGVAELPLLSFLILGKSFVPLPVCVAAHMASSLLIFLAPPKGPGWLHPMRYWARPLALWTLVLPCWGWILAGALYLGHSPDSDRKDSSLDSEIGEPDLPEEESRPQVAMRLLDAVDIVPAVDALLSQDPTLKRGAIETLAKIRTPDALQWLLKARLDSSPEVRFYATATLTSLRRDYEERLQASEHEALQKPMEIHPQIAFCQVAYEYALSGLVESGLRQELLLKCRGWLQNLADQDGTALRSLYLVEKELDPPAALSLLERLSEVESEGRLAWLKERALLLFHLRRYPDVLKTMRILGDALRKSDSTLSKSATNAKDWEAVVLWWSQR